VVYIIFDSGGRKLLKKTFLHNLFSKCKHGGLRVVYWDGDDNVYGDEVPRVKITFHKEPPAALTVDPVIAIGEAYMDDIIDIDGEFDEAIKLMTLNNDVFANHTLLAKTVTGLQGEQKNIQHHYDIGNEFFKLWLDKTMSYSCAYFKSHSDSLYQAQLQKIDHILKKLNLSATDHLLDIGCGWGWLLIRAAQQYNVQATGITLSSEQFAAATESVKKLGLQDQIHIKLANYQELDPKTERFDKIVSIGMFEHVGKANLPKYMNKVNELLLPGGISLLHTITGMIEEPGNSWILKYIFPGGYAPSLRETIWLLPQFDFHLLHAESLRIHYAMTIEKWYSEFLQHSESIQLKYGRRFFRMWELYLRGCAASFRCSGTDIYQLLFTKGLNNSLPLTFDYLYHD
jgi:cyclopropane-fatty-acyl-phospholipid synthase